MGNGQSRDEFAGVLPSVSAAKGSEAPPISEAWSSAAPISTSDPVPLLFGRIVPPGHALQLEEATTSNEASEIARAFNTAERFDDRFVIPESVRKSRTLDAFADVCSEILPGFLYVSNLRVARDAAKLRALGVTHVINCCGELNYYEDGAELPPRNESELQVLRLLLRDDANEDLTPFLPQVMEYIASCRQSQGNGARDKVLVHCHQGVSRSCAFAIAYVMLEQQLSYREAAAIVKRQRAISSPNAAFICQLLEWEKDLREEATFALGGLHRLAPHSSYDPACLVLKRCYEPSTDSSRQRQNVANVRTAEDEQRLLWSRGTFVFQNPITPTDLTIWSGAKCAIPEAVAIATQLAGRLLHLQTLVLRSDDTSRQMKIVQVDERTDRRTGTDIDHFGYDAELRWSPKPAPQVSKLPLPVDEEDTSDDANKISNSGPLEAQPQISVRPQLFILEAIGEQGGEHSWDELTNYDSEDLTADSVFLLCSMKSHGAIEGFVWLGTDCTIATEKVVEVAQKQIQRLHHLSDGAATSSTTVERQNEESDAFWQLFEAGY